MNRTKVKRQARLKHGFTIIESAIILAIMAFALAATVVLFNTLSNNMKARQSIEDVKYLQGFISAQYTTSPVYTNMSARSLLRTNELHKRFIGSSTSTLVNAYGGTITFGTARYLGGINNVYDIRFANIPKAACVKMTSQNYGRKLVSVYINSRRRITTPVSTSVATQRCNRDQNWVTFRFL